MLPRALPAAYRPAALSAPQPISTGHLLADCERWCRDHLPPRPLATPRAYSERLAPISTSEFRARASSSSAS